MKRVLINPMPEAGVEITLDRDEAHHLKVRRAQVGESLEILDGSGGLALGELIEFGGRKAVIRVTAQGDEDRESPRHVEIGIAIPSQISTFDQHLPALVQLGVVAVHLVPVTYGGRLKKDPSRYRERLSEIQHQALKQSGRLKPPTLHFSKDFETLCADFNRRLDSVVMLHPVSQPLRAEKGSLGLLIGPEGGFSEDEVAIARGLDIDICGLGPRILKLETALVGAAFWAQQSLG